ncbi:MAG: glutamate racemase [Bacteroidetes bacterium SW_10_40_5]|nr:MAG: glutamate racemase [Bacteroidetes bacterium SW_10_40_5]
MTDNRPIGIFDSGIGGLTIAQAINQLLPKESIVFFGDTTHLPYGDKSSQSVKHFSEKIFHYLKDKQSCKAIIIACNTASSAAYHHLFQKFGSELEVINVIDPVVAYCVKKLKAEQIGVIGTKGTIRSRAYPRKINTLNSEIKVNSASTPLLAPMIEEGFYNNNISRTIIITYLSKPQLQKIDTLILACTHYPLIKNEIQEFYTDNVKVVDSTDVIADYTKHILEQNELLSNPNAQNMAHKFYVSDFTDSFQATAKMFFHDSIKLEAVNI